ncbi:MAG TPA: DNA primase, partial [Acidimicrobiales bacterium]|nr:DNA primase [Acidimicrobiales bacterium]
KGFYYCFGCQASGDAITFVRATEHLEFADAVRLLADRAGVTIHEDAELTKDRKRRADLLDAMERAVAWYHERLLRAPDAGPARDYLRSRGYDGEVVRQFRLGWAPDEWDALSTALRLPERVLTDTGLGFVNRRGRAQDSFRARVLFPICDPSGRPVALGGRILPPRGGQRAPERPEPKYKNSQETAIYSKRRTLYALNWAKHDVIAKGEVVVCEGYTDVIGFFQAGVPRAVATCGTALGEEHFTLLRNFGRRIVLAYDADAAGQSATSRVYEWERRHEVDVFVADLPRGHDPGDLARSDPEALVRAVTEARPFLQFRVDRILNGADLATAEGRARAADAALAAVAEHPDDLVRDQYIMQLADRCRMEAPRLRERLEHVRSHPPAPRDTPHPLREHPTEEWDDVTSEALTAAQRAGPGLEALKLAVHHPEEVDERLQPVLFSNELQRDAFLALVEADDVQGAIAASAPAVGDLLRRVTVEEPRMGDPDLGDPVDAVVRGLLRDAVRRAVAEVQQRARGGDLDWQKGAAVALDVAQPLHWLAELDDPSAGRSASERLVAWLSDRERHE